MLQVSNLPLLYYLTLCIIIYKFLDNELICGYISLVGTGLIRLICGKYEARELPTLGDMNLMYRLANTMVGRGFQLISHILRGERGQLAEFQPWVHLWGVKIYFLSHGQ